jgi:hypothetical protein
MFDYFNGFWDWAQNNPEKVNPNNTSIYFYFLSVANELKWRSSFGLSSTQIMNGIGIKSYKTYKKHLDELVENGLILITKESKNQYQCNEFALVNFTEAHTKARPKHVPKQVQSTSHNHKTNKESKDYKDTKEANVYFVDNEVNGLFIEFIKNRIELKKAPTQRAIELMVKKARKIYKSKADVIQGIENSIASGWSDLFPIKPNQPKQKDESYFSRAERGINLK